MNKKHQKTNKKESKIKDLDWPMLGTFFYQLLFFVFLQVLLKCIDQERSFKRKGKKIPLKGTVWLADWLLPYFVAVVYF